jgi:hypothetical protein
MGRNTSSPVLAFTSLHGLRKIVPRPGLPDDISADQKSQFVYTLWVLWWKMLVYFRKIGFTLLPLGIFCVHLEYFVVIWNILWSFGIFCGHLEYFVVIWHIFRHFGMFCRETSSNPFPAATQPSTYVQKCNKKKLFMRRFIIGFSFIRVWEKVSKVSRTKKPWVVNPYYFVLLT